MDRILIRGGKPLSGTVAISGAKNAALPIMAASLLTSEPLQLDNVADLADIASMQRLLQHVGVSATYVAGEPTRMVLHAPDILTATAPYDLVRKMRASVLVLGPLLARTGRARVSLPGGCAIGPRPIDLHLMGLERLGARIELVDGYVEATGDSVDIAFVDAGYNGPNAAAAAQAQGIELVVVKLPEAKKGFVLLPRRWVIERSFGWTTRFRRLVRDYERYASTLARLHFVAFVCLMLRQAARLVVSP